MRKMRAFGNAGSNGMSSRPSADPIALPDVISTSLNVMFCGINPGMKSAAVGLHFANRSNRFWRVLHLSGFTSMQLEPEQARILLDFGYGITSAVPRPTTSAADLRRADFIAARPAFVRKVVKHKPRYLAVLGRPACAVFLNLSNPSWGLQPTTLGGSAVWVLPNPSGLNRAFTIGMLTSAYRDLLEAVIHNDQSVLPSEQ